MAPASLPADEPPPSYDYALASALSESESRPEGTGSSPAAPALPARPSGVPGATGAVAPPQMTSHSVSAASTAAATPSPATTAQNTATQPPTWPQPPPQPQLPARPTPTETPQAGHPLLNHGRLLVYPLSHKRCNKCGDTGYKSGDISNPCKRCWRTYGREYSSALRHAYENSESSVVLDGVKLQAPLPDTSGFGTYFGASGGYAPTAPAWPAPQPAWPSRPPAAPSSAGPPAEVFPEDKHDSAPPRYELASSTEKPLPQQAYLAPQVPPAPSPSWGHAPQGPYSGYPAYPAHMGPSINWYGPIPPSGAISVMPGDPRIGGVLCPKCGGTGNTANLISIFFGDEECELCGGAGRVPG